MLNPLLFGKIEGDLIGSELVQFFYKHGLNIIAIILPTCCLVHYCQILVKSLCYNIYIFIRYGTVKIEAWSTHDKIVNCNRRALNTPKYDASKELFVREAFFKNNPVENADKHVLNECSTCLQSLIERKRAGDSLKVTECGHVFCLDCMNRFFDSAYQDANGLVKCPTCVRPLTRDQVTYISNIFI